MNPARAADAYQKIAEGFAELALAVGEPAAQAAPLPPFEEPEASADTFPPAGYHFTESSTRALVQDEAKPAGSEAVCPAHGKAFIDGKFGPYCPSTSDDPNWSNRKGYCNVTPKSAAAWLRQHA